MRKYEYHVTMSDYPAVKIIFDKTWEQTDLPARFSAERHIDQFVVTVKNEDVPNIVNEFLSKRQLHGMVFVHVPTDKLPPGTKTCDKCNGAGVLIDGQ